MTKIFYVFYKGYDNQLDEAIRALMKPYKEDGSGFAFFNEERDMSFTVPANKVARLKKKMENAGFRVEVYGSDDD